MPLALQPPKPVFIFDIGGVVIKWKDNDPIFKFVADRYGVPFNRMKQVMQEGITEFESGRISSRGYFENCLKQVGKKMKKGDDPDWLMTFPCERLVKLRKGTVGIIKMLRRKGYKVYALTNTSSPHVEMARRLGWDALFDRYFASCEIGAVKPDKKAFQYVLEQASASPEQTVFIDNNTACVGGGKRAGIKRSFHFRSVSLLRKEIAEILEELYSPVEKS